MIGEISRSLAVLLIRIQYATLDSCKIYRQIDLNQLNFF